MIYYTQLIFLKEGQAELFHKFEDQVLPLVSRHNGELLYRIRPTQNNVIASTMGQPYEIHLVSFQSRKDFESYRDDKERRQHLPLKDQSVEKILLIEGNLL
ncbi:DUF1330 domain-containing protein [Rhodocytophaga rosea]|uniref:DUF1330 domain-containing protein n=1 Tax=Rhodocytophaga rosea TaxID=2704465 RepID=A0A6C0GCK4_9BACT|nr:DUF1330 domain-containing protein [Rhodocytophaga rosea]QHT65562.1 DUF1330 domain-containing protein [Rhodocytophaga rosea]